MPSIDECLRNPLSRTPQTRHRSRGFATSIRLPTLLRWARKGAQLDRRCHGFITHARPATRRSPTSAIKPIRKHVPPNRRQPRLGARGRNLERPNTGSSVLRRVEAEVLRVRDQLVRVTPFDGRLPSLAIARAESFAPARSDSDTSCRGIRSLHAVETSCRARFHPFAALSRWRTPDCSGGALPTRLREEDSLSTHPRCLPSQGLLVRGGAPPQVVYSLWIGAKRLFNLLPTPVAWTMRSVGEGTRQW